MLEGTSTGDFDSGTDFFSMLGGETRKKKQPPSALDPDQVFGSLIKPVLFTKILSGRR